jgi:hypothetical protein
MLRMRLFFFPFAQRTLRRGAAERTTLHDPGAAEPKGAGSPNRGIQGFRPFCPGQA